MSLQDDAKLVLAWEGSTQVAGGRYGFPTRHSIRQAAKRLAQSVLDGDEPVTREWWQSLPGTHENQMWLVISEFESEYALFLGNNNESIYVVMCIGSKRTIAITQINDPTRRDVRDLCRVLGIELKEES